MKNKTVFAIWCAVFLALGTATFPCFAGNISDENPDLETILLRAPHLRTSAEHAAFRFEELVSAPSSPWSSLSENELKAEREAVIKAFLWIETHMQLAAAKKMNLVSLGRTIWGELLRELKPLLIKQQSGEWSVDDLAKVRALMHQALALSFLPNFTAVLPMELPPKKMGPELARYVRLALSPLRYLYPGRLPSDSTVNAPSISKHMWATNILGGLPWGYLAEHFDIIPHGTVLGLFASHLVLTAATTSAVLGHGIVELAKAPFTWPSARAAERLYGDMRHVEKNASNLLCTAVILGRRPY
ncbi:MAG TPA: hypothetical protein PLH57_00240 [Oligoflexia bacterium]|nr:hypothetical protein [Oligoflexia bacterium]